MAYDADRIFGAACTFERGAAYYGGLADRLGRYAHLADDERLGGQTRQVVGLVCGSCRAYLATGAYMLQDAAKRLRGRMAEEGCARKGLFRQGGRDVSGGAATDQLVCEPPDTGGAVDARAAALDFDCAARALYDWVHALADAAELVGDADLVGDTHPYADVVYGICIPYLLRASELLYGEAEDAPTAR